MTVKSTLDRRSPQRPCWRSRSDPRRCSSLCLLRRSSRWSNKAIDVSSGAQAFITALQSIRTAVSVGTKLECEWAIPEPPKGQDFNKEKVNLTFTPKGGAPTDFGYVDSAAACANSSNAWYFDNKDDPKRILACPTTCEMLKASSGAQMDVKFGCERKPAIIE
jgi:hypothetical protein